MLKAPLKLGIVKLRITISLTLVLVRKLATLLSLYGKRPNMLDLDFLLMSQIPGSLQDIIHQETMTLREKKENNLRLMFPNSSELKY